MDAQHTNLKVGDRAPEFQVFDSTGTTRTLAEMVASGPRVFLFYRGYW